MKKTLHPTAIFLCMLLTCSVFSQHKETVFLHTGPVAFPENVQAYTRQATIGKHEMIAGHYYRLLQFYELPGPGQLKDIKSRGIELLEYIPHHTYVAAIPTHFDLKGLAGLGVRSIQELSTAWKMSPELFQRNLPDWALDQKGVKAILKFHKNLSIDAVKDFCRADGLDIRAGNGINDFLRIVVAADRLQETAELPYVAFLDLVPAPDVPDDIFGRSLHRSNVIDTPFPNGRNYTGEGVGVLCRDDGEVGPHIDFEGRLFNFQTLGNSGFHHGDGVSGIMAGAGNVDPWNKGMASGSDLYVVDYQSDFLDSTLRLHTDYNVLVTNSSYSNGCNAGYTSTTEIVDQQLYLYPTLMHVFSAGNSNNLDCGYGAGSTWGNITGGHKQAKNCITVANLWADASLNNTSSRGPAHDGRLKPDIAAHGADQISTYPNHTYQVFGGTSAAAPGIAGITAQLHQAYRELHSGETAEAALLKACLLNTANDLGNEGPDFKFGWGHVNSYRAVLTLEEERHFKATVQANEINTHTITIPNNTVQARIMVYWMDPEASVMTSKALVNDLDAWISDGSGNEFLPWILDPTPNPASLDMPAFPGVDTLNNVEQVALENPAPGEYTLHVQGSELPFGSHDYFVVWEFRQNDVTVTHPVGGEGFAPGENVYIHWDSQTDPGYFDIELSTDGGNTYELLHTATGNERLWEWAVPDKITGDAMIRVRRDDNGPEDTNDVPFSIAPRPANVRAIQACPGFLRITWDEVDLSSAGSTTSYEVFRLGDKFMESMGTTSALEFDIPIPLGMTAIVNEWFAVRTVGENNLRSERTIAEQYIGGLLDCEVTDDLEMVSIDAPKGNSLLGCLSIEAMLTVTVKNAGISPQTNAQVAYILNNGPPVVETLNGTLEPGTTLSHTFSEPLSFPIDGTYTLEAYTLLANDLVTYNDRIESELDVSIYTGTGEPVEFKEDFEGGTLPPDYFLIYNPDGAATWDFTEVIGSDGSMTTCAWINNFVYNASGQEDEMIMVPVDLTGIPSASLSFDVAYALFNATYQDGLRVTISTDCGSTFPDTLYEKFGGDLASLPFATSPFTPGGANAWRKDVISLNDYLGESVVIKFTAINDYGNAMYLDNINVSSTSLPQAGFTVSSDPACAGIPVTFTSTSTGEDLSYKWTFGAGVIPSATFIEGPVGVIFNNTGTYSVSLEVTNLGGTHTYTEEIEVIEAPVPEFTFDQTGASVSFSNASQFANSYLWDFGDGSTSTDAEPIHTYTTNGTYTVTLSAISDCGSVEATQEVTINLNNIADPVNELEVWLAPNPAKDRCLLQVDRSTASELDIRLLDVRGVVHNHIQLSTQNGSVTYEIPVTPLPAGLYLVEVRGGEAVKILKLIVE